MRIVRAVLATGFVAAVLFAAWLLFVWPPPSWYRTHWPSATAFMRMRARQARIAHDTTSRHYRPVPLDSISTWLPKAATAGEDDAFYQHHGIDWHALRQAIGYRRDSFAWRNPRDRADLRRLMGNAYAERDKLRGASTITQQLAKNLYLSPSRNPLRKVKEAFIAWRLEWVLPKDRIMELYLNIAELGPNVWGVEAASQRYFKRSAAQLSMEQAAMLVATLPHPRTSNPAWRPGRTRWRQALILRRLRGEDIEVPEEVADEAEVLAPLAPTDTVLPVTPLPADTSMPVDTLPADTLPPDTPQAPAPGPTRDTTKPETKPPER